MNKDELLQATRNPWWQTAFAVALIVLVAIAALGGFKKAQSKVKPLPRTAAGQPFDNGAFVITPLRAWVADHQPGRPPYPWLKVQYLVLQVVIENRTDHSYATFGHPLRDVILLSPSNQPIEPKAAYYSDDHLQADELGPRLPTRLDLVWELPKGASVGTTRAWGVFTRTFKEKVHLNEESAWVQGEPGTKFEMKIENHPPAAKSAAP